jgi:hypothetical protein
MLFTSSSSQDFSPPRGFNCSINFQILCSRSPLAHPFGFATCMNLLLLAFHFHLSGAIHGVFKERRCWWAWRGDWAKCLSPVTGMEGLFCASFCESRGAWGPCRMTWHTNCCECLGIGQFLLCLHQDIKGNLWFKQKAKENEINQGVRWAHATMSFQCEWCWFINLEGHLPESNLDDMYLKLMHRANLDAMSGRAITTTAAHAAATKRLVRKCALIGKTPTIPLRGPLPMSDLVGMSVAMDMLFHSLTANPRLEGELHIPFDSMR